MTSDMRHRGPPRMWRVQAFSRAGGLIPVVERQAPRAPRVDGHTLEAAWATASLRDRSSALRLCDSGPVWSPDDARRNKLRPPRSDHFAEGSRLFDVPLLGSVQSHQQKARIRDFVRALSARPDGGITLGRRDAQSFDHAVRKFAEREPVAEPIDLATGRTADLPRVVHVANNEREPSRRRVALDHLATIQVCHVDAPTIGLMRPPVHSRLGNGVRNQRASTLNNDDRDPDVRSLGRMPLPGHRATRRWRPARP